MAASIGSPREEFARPSWAAGQRPVPHDLTPFRDRLPLPAGLARPVERELIQTYARTALKAAPYHLVLTVAVAAMATALTPLATLLPGIVLTGLVVVAVAILARTFLAQEPSGDSIATWRRLFAIAEVMHATGWIMIALPLIAHPAEARTAPPRTASRCSSPSWWRSRRRSCGRRSRPRSMRASAR
jgi:hypothetical protein